MCSTLEEVHSNYLGTTITERSLRSSTRMNTCPGCIFWKNQTWYLLSQPLRGLQPFGSSWRHRHQSRPFTILPPGSSSRLRLMRQQGSQQPLVRRLTSSTAIKNAMTTMIEHKTEPITTLPSSMHSVCLPKTKLKWHVITSHPISLRVDMVRQTTTSIKTTTSMMMVNVDASQWTTRLHTPSSPRMTTKDAYASSMVTVNLHAHKHLWLWIKLADSYKMSWKL